MMVDIGMFKEIVLSKLKKLGMKTSSVLLSVLALNIPMNVKAVDNDAVSKVNDLISQSESTDSFFKRHFKLIIGGGITLLTAIGGTAFLVKKFGKSNEPKPAVPVNNNPNVSTNNLVPEKNLNSNIVDNLAQGIFNIANEMSNELSSPLSGNLTNSSEMFKTIKQTCDNLNKVLEGVDHRINGPDGDEMAKKIKKTCDNLNVVLAKTNDFNSVEMVEAVKRTCNNLDKVLEVLHCKINDDSNAGKVGQLYDSLNEAIKKLGSGVNSIPTHRQMHGDLSRNPRELESESGSSSESSETESDTDTEKDERNKMSGKRSEMPKKKTKELDSKFQDRDPVMKLDESDKTKSENTRNIEKDETDKLPKQRHNSVEKETEELALRSLIPAVEFDESQQTGFDADDEKNESKKSPKKRFEPNARNSFNNSNEHGNFKFNDGKRVYYSKKLGRWVETDNGPFQRIYNKVFKSGSESKNSEIELDDLNSSNSSGDSSDSDE